MDHLHRRIQHATLANEGVSEGDNSSYIIPYLIGAIGLLVALNLARQYTYWWVCKNIFGREDPIDPDELLSNLSEEQRNKVLAFLINRAATLEEVDQQTEENLDARGPQGPGPGSTAITLEASKVENDPVASVAAPEEDDTDEKSMDIEGGGGEAPSSSECEKDEGVQKSETSSPILPCNPLASPDESNSSASSEDDDDHRQEVCPICIAHFGHQYPVFQSKECPHKFHAKCILEWLQTKNHHNADCPVCRAEVVSKDEMVVATLVLMKQDGWDTISPTSSE